MPSRQSFTNHKDQDLIVVSNDSTNVVFSVDKDSKYINCWRFKSSMIDMGLRGPAE